MKRSNENFVLTNATELNVLIRAGPLYLNCVASACSFRWNLTYIVAYAKMLWEKNNIRSLKSTDEAVLKNRAADPIQTPAPAACYTRPRLPTRVCYCCCCARLLCCCYACTPLLLHMLCACCMLGMNLQHKVFTARYVWNSSNICNICNTRSTFKISEWNTLQCTSETAETIEAYICNIHV
jgi:hypothetical protein